MSELQNILLRPSISESVEALHIRLAQECTALMAAIPEENLFGVLLSSPTMKIYPVEWKKRVLSALADKSEAMPTVNDLGVFSIPEISGLDGVYRFLLDAQKYGWMKTLFHPNPKRDELSEISILSDSGSVHLAIKYFWLAKGHKIEDYYGMVPYTRPIKDTMKNLWGTDFGSCLRANAFQQRLAVELGKSPFWTNSALWLWQMKQ